MSLQDIMNPTTTTTTTEAQTFDTILKDTSKQPLRSWRKKYRKMKLRFDKAMDESSSLYRDCHKLEILAKRLQEENDQYLETLLNLNESSHTPSFELGSPHEDIDPVPSASAVPALEPDEPPSLKSLLARVPHTHLDSGISRYPIELTLNPPPGYLSPAYEEEYLATLDAQIMGPTGLDNVWRPLQVAQSRQLPPEKELHNSNPVSVLSWLRRNHPETFIQEKEAQIDKPAPRARGGGGGKRSSLAQSANAGKAGTPAVEEAVKEEGGADALPGEKVNGRGKKGKEDEPYRPKGGSSRPSKRKRGGDTDKAEPKNTKRPKGGAS
ncbi:ATPase [Venturia nashicola]|uniref:ATPase n=1 Tax=Venturia nashicola TaxID=86259 RepID=A0A4Z1P600_9PEZI|nr:ATPase [Venturia nashicola]